MVPFNATVMRKTTNNIKLMFFLFPKKTCGGRATPAVGRCLASVPWAPAPEKPADVLADADKERRWEKDGNAFVFLITVVFFFWVSIFLVV